MSDRAAELAYMEGVRALSEQQASLESARSRVGTVFPIAAVGTGFLAAAALNGRTGMPWGGWLAIAFLILTAVCVVVVVWPRRWKWTNDPSVLAGSEWQGREPDDVNRHLALHLANHMKSNDQKLNGVWWWVSASVVSSMLSVTAWVLLLAKVT